MLDHAGRKKLLIMGNPVHDTCKGARQLSCRTGSSWLLDSSDEETGLEEQLWQLLINLNFTC